MSMTKNNLADWPAAGSGDAPFGLVEIHASGLSGGLVLAVLVDIAQ